MSLAGRVFEFDYPCPRLRRALGWRTRCVGRVVKRRQTTYSVRCMILRIGDCGCGKKHAEMVDTVVRVSLTELCIVDAITALSLIAVKP